MAERIIQIGDIVRLRSGGKPMSVKCKLDAAEYGDNVYLCDWHDDQGVPHSHTYHLDQFHSEEDRALVRERIQRMTAIVKSEGNASA